jgi:hypothetical protein
MEDGIPYVIHQISYRGWKDALVPLDLDVFKAFLDTVDKQRSLMSSPTLPSTYFIFLNLRKKNFN